VACIESSIWTSLVDTNVCTISTPESSAASITLSTTRANPQVVELVAEAMSRTASNSASELTGNPASMTWVPISSRMDAICRLSSEKRCAGRLLAVPEGRIEDTC